MNFSRHQEQAERAARRLLWLYALATVSVVLAVDLAAALLWNLAWAGSLDYPQGFLLTNTLVVGGLILGGSWLETARLREGGAVIALRLGAVEVDPDADEAHRRLRNVAEELAIAARIAVPRVFVLEDEPSINALAAGFDRNDSVVVVTRGALQRLTRDELQGVVAHELSHVVNGDVALNTRLVGLNYGLELVALLGRTMLSRAVLGASAARAGATPMLLGVPLAAAGVTLAALGSIGELAARAIKAGIGRQREFFADAQAVRFTRQRDGLGGALRKVLALQQGNGAWAGWRAGAAASLRHPYWHNVSHLLLAGPERAGGWFATHPTLQERLRRLYGRSVEALDAAVIHTAARAREPDLPALDFALAGDPLRGDAPLPVAWLMSPGRRAPVPLEKPWMGASVKLAQATRDPRDACALVIALLQDAAGPPPTWPASWRSSALRAEALRAALRGLSAAGVRALRWPLVELAAARIRPMPKPLREDLVQMVRQMVTADGRVTLEEWIYFSLLRLRLLPQPSGAGPASGARPVADAPAVRLVFALVAHCVHLGEVRADRAANAAIRDLHLAPIGSSPRALTLEALDQAVSRLRQLPALAKPLLVRHLASVLPPDASDDVRDFLRVLCVAVDCPPPVLPPRLGLVATDDPPHRGAGASGAVPAHHAAIAH